MQPRATATRNHILRSATKLFAAAGFHGARIEAIAEDAQVNKQRIYAYFGSKASLFEQCLLAVFAELNVFEENLAELKPKNEIDLTKIILKKYFSLHLNHPEFWRMLAWANLENGIAVDKLFKAREKGFAGLRKHFNMFRKAGFLPKVSFQTYIFTLTAVTYFYFSNQRTLSSTLSPALFSATGMKKLHREVVQLLSRTDCKNLKGIL